MILKSSTFLRKRAFAETDPAGTTQDGSFRKFRVSEKKN